MKTTTQYLSKKKLALKTKLTSKIKSTIHQYKRCRIWVNQGLKLFAASWNVTPVGGRTSINDIFRGLDEDRNLLVKRLDGVQKLYPNCDTSIWLRNCTREIINPIQGKIKGK